jgi:hypothetical protein
MWPSVLITLQDSIDLYTDSLGQVLGNIVILVDLRRDESLWYAAESTLQGFLPLQIGFQQNGRIRLLSTCVDITLKDADANDGVFVDKTFSLQPLVPRQSLKQVKLDTKEWHVEPEAGVLGNGAKVGGGSHKSKTKSAVRETWSFQSARMASQSARFSWGRTSVTDESGVIRAYVCALLMRRGTHQDTNLEVVVSINAKKLGRRHVGRRRVERRGGPVTTTVGRESGDQCAPSELNHERLNDNIGRLNVELVPRSKVAQSSGHMR